MSAVSFMSPVTFRSTDGASAYPLDRLIHGGVGTKYIQKAAHPEQIEHLGLQRCDRNFTLRYAQFLTRIEDYLQTVHRYIFCLRKIENDVVRPFDNRGGDQLVEIRGAGAINRSARSKDQNVTTNLFFDVHCGLSMKSVLSIVHLDVILAIRPRLVAGRKWFFRCGVRI